MNSGFERGEGGWPGRSQRSERKAVGHGASHAGSQRNSVYPSKVDVWVGALIMISLAAGLCAAFALFRTESVGDRFVAALTLLLLGGVGAIIFPVRYHITEQELLVQSGVWKIRVPLHSILRVVPSRSVLASPALSIDRLAVQYQKSRFSRPEILISPVRREEFLREIGAAAGLEPGNGGAWERADPIT